MSVMDGFWIGFMTAYFAVGMLIWGLARREKAFIFWRALIAFGLLWPLFLVDVKIITPRLADEK